MEELTSERAIALHREMWDWLAEDPAREMWDWPRWKYNGGDVEEATSDCLLCEWGETNGLDCEKKDACLLSWPGGGTCGSTYDAWCDAEGEERTAFARAIRDLPIDEGHALRLTCLHASRRGA